MSPANTPDLGALIAKMSPEKQQLFQQLGLGLTGKGGM